MSATVGTPPGSASLECAAAQPGALLRSSRGLGWRGLLVDHHRGVGNSGVFETHPTDDLTLVVKTRGRSLVQVFKHGRWRPAVYDAGNAGLTAPLDTTRIFYQTLNAEKTFETAHFYIAAQTIDAVREEYHRAGRRQSDRPISALVFRDPTVAAIGGEALNAIRAGVPSLYAEQMAGFIAAHIVARHTGWWDPDSERRMPAVLGDRPLARVLDYMSAHLGEDLTLARLAGEACISIHHFVRRFRERMGVTPFVYLTSLRIEAAQRMLRTTDLPVAEIARLCGYSNPGAFSSAFHRGVGESPRDFRSSTGLR